jgi:hypothetical protein
MSFQGWQGIATLIGVVVVISAILYAFAKKTK